MADDVRWFDALGPCGHCGRPAHGKLMGSRNQSYGAYCKGCADRRVANAMREREREAISRADAATPSGHKNPTDTGVA